MPKRFYVFGVSALVFWVIVSLLIRNFTWGIIIPLGLALVYFDYRTKNNPDGSSKAKLFKYGRNIIIAGLVIMCLVGIFLFLFLLAEF
ncbi:MAG: hypothetical protein Q8P07_01025 [bacterium]|nr:hypothetical protein [bacterium]